MKKTIYYSQTLNAKSDAKIAAMRSIEKAKEAEAEAILITALYYIAAFSASYIAYITF